MRSDYFGICLWNLRETWGRRDRSERTGMAKSASTGTAGSIADGGMVPVEGTFFWVWVAHVPLKSIKVRGMESGIC